MEKREKYTIEEVKPYKFGSGGEIHIRGVDPMRSVLVTRAYDTPAVQELVSDANRADFLQIQLETSNTRADAYMKTANEEKQRADRTTDLLREFRDKIGIDYENSDADAYQTIEDVDAFLSNAPAAGKRETDNALEAAICRAIELEEFNDKLIKANSVLSAELEETEFLLSRAQDNAVNWKKDAEKSAVDWEAKYREAEKMLTKIEENILFCHGAPMAMVYFDRATKEEIQKLLADSASAEKGAGEG